MSILILFPTTLVQNYEGVSQVVNLIYIKQIKFCKKRQAIVNCFKFMQWQTNPTNSDRVGVLLKICCICHKFLLPCKNILFEEIRFSKSRKNFSTMLILYIIQALHKIIVIYSSAENRYNFFLRYPSYRKWTTNKFRRKKQPFPIFCGKIWYGVSVKLIQ